MIDFVYACPFFQRKMNFEEMVFHELNVTKKVGFETGFECSRVVTL